MLQIKVKGEFVDVGEASITLKFENPMFRQNPLNNAFSYSFTLPVTPRNSAIFDNVERIDSSAESNNLPCEIFFEGILMLQGVLSIKNPNNDSYSCFINNEDLAISKRLKDFRIRDLDLESIHQYDFHPDSFASLEDRWNFQEDSFQAFKNDPFNEDDIDATHSWPTVLSESYGYNEGDQQSFPDFNWPFRFINPFTDGSYQYNHPFDTTNIEQIFWSVTYIPFIKYTHVLKEIFKVVNLTIIGDFLELTDIKQLSMFNNNTVDADPPVSDFQPLKRDLKLEDHLPDVSGLAIVNLLKVNFNQILFIDKNSIEVRSVTEILNTPEEDLTKFTNPKYSYSRKFSEGFSFSYADDSKDVLFKNPEYTPAKVVIGDGKTDITSPDRYLFVTQQYVSVNWALWASFPTLPIVAADPIGSLNTVGVYRGPLKGDSYPSTLLDIFGLPFVDVSGPDDHLDNLVLTFYRGKQLNNLGNPYPLATPFSTEPSIGKVGDLSLTWDGDDGLVETFYKPFIEAINQSKEITRLLDLPVHKVSEMSRFRFPNYKIQSPAGQMRGILKELSITLKGNKASKSTCLFVAKEQSDTSIA